MTTDNELTPVETPTAKTRSSLPPQHKYIQVIANTVIDLAAMGALLAMSAWNQIDPMIAALGCAMIAGIWAGSGETGTLGLLSGLLGKLKGGASIIPVALAVALSGCGAGWQEQAQDKALDAYRKVHQACSAIAELPVPPEPEVTAVPEPPVEPVAVPETPAEPEAEEVEEESVEP